MSAANPVVHLLAPSGYGKLVWCGCRMYSRTYFTSTLDNATCQECIQMAASSNLVDSPPHYLIGGIESLDVIKAKLSPEEFQGYCVGNVLKYAMRWRHKDGLQDLKKARVYLGRLITSLEQEQPEHD